MNNCKLKALAVCIASINASSAQAENFWSWLPFVGDETVTEDKAAQDAADNAIAGLEHDSSGAWVEIDNQDLDDKNSRQYFWRRDPDSDEYGGALRGRIYDDADLNEPAYDALQPYHLPENSEYLQPADTKFVFWGLESLQPTSVDMSETMFEEVPGSTAETLRFSSGQSDVGQTYRDIIGVLVKQLEGRRISRLSLVGHTDNQRLSAPTQARYRSNLGLSIARAEEVALILQKELGLTDEQVSWGGEGDSMPLASNDTAEGMAKNRRVEAEIWFEKAVVPQQRPVSRTLICQSTLSCRYYLDPLVVADTNGVIAENEIPADLLNAPEFIDAQCAIEQPQLDLDRVYTEQYQLDVAIDPVMFASGSHQISQGYIAYLKDIVDRLRAEQDIVIRFTGHTDSDPLYHTKDIYGDNQGLSDFRAREIMAILVPVLGIPEDRADYLGYGASRPVAANDVEQNKARNRRVEIEIWAERQIRKTAYEVSRVERLDNQSDYARDPYGLSPFRISVDGQPLDAGEQANMADNQRCVDVALEATDIQVVPDNLMLKPSLSVTASKNRLFKEAELSDSNASAFNHRESRQDQTEFFGYSNYLAYIESAEVRIFRLGDELDEEPLIVLPLDSNLRAQWTYDPVIFEPNSDQSKTLLEDDSDSVFTKPDELVYLLRTYGDKGRYDETQPQRLWINSVAFDEESSAEGSPYAHLSAYGENMLARQRIKLDGGTIRVNGSSVPADHEVFVMGRAVPIDRSGSFATEQIIPEGYHNIEVAVLDQQGNGELFQRELELKEEDWFYVGIADLTLGTSDTNGPASEVTQDSSYDDDSFAVGRLAFFAQGKTASGTEITASADSREEPLGDLFSNFTSKDPSVLFRRLDEDLYYPTFGDDSTIEEAAPTQGKFYVKAEKNDDHLLWGNFDASIGNSELTKIDRGLYGAQLDYGSEQRTDNGDEQYRVELFAAEPGTIGAREEFRGTGGSLYYLKHQDITVGSENLYIETRDSVSGRIIDRERLSDGRDYNLDYLQGRILLEGPLTSSSSDGSLINQDSLGGDENYLVVTYEYVPGFEALDDLALGGRVSAFVSDSIELGVTALDQEQLGAQHRIMGVDISLDDRTGNYFKAELAQSEGLAVNQLESINGGFGFSEIDQSSNPDIQADALRLEGGTLFDNGVRITGYAQVREEGYSGAGQLTDTDTLEASFSAILPLTKKLSARIDVDKRDEDVGQSEDLIEGQLAYQLDEQWAIDLGVEFDTIENTDSSIQSFTDYGDRTDLGVAVSFDSLGDWKAYGFGQYTYDVDTQRERNDRLGVGVTYQLSERFRLDGELSEGTTGLGAQAGVDYLATERTSLYFSLANDNQRSTSGLRTLNGNATAGFKTRYNERLNLYGEERYAYGDQPVGLTHAYGLDFAANEYWNFGGSAELGTLRNEDRSEIERTALTFLTGYSTDRIGYAGDIEYRKDTTATNDRLTWLTRQSLNYQQTEDWRLLLGIDWSKSESSQGEFYDGDFTEAVAGYAYRPVYNDRLNALVKYTYFFNKAAPEQVSTGNNVTDFIQRSHIFSVDATYDLTPRWSLGGKYAFKRGELALDRENPQYFRSDTQLLVIRADLHLVNSWDFLLEARALDAVDAQDRRSGLLTALYWHMNRNVKIGGGYNFTDFSDDLTDLSFDDEGFFLNIIGKM